MIVVFFNFRVSELNKNISIVLIFYYSHLYIFNFKSHSVIKNNKKERLNNS